VRYDYDPDHATNLHYRSGFDNTESQESAKTGVDSVR
jgi:hypothetical protein